MKNFLIKLIISISLIFLYSSEIQAVRVYPEDSEFDTNYLRKKDFNEWDRYDRRRYDDYYHRNCENRAQRLCREYRHLYWEYLDLSEYYRRVGRFNRANEYRRRADDAMRDYRHCLNRELNNCRRDYWRDRDRRW